MSGPDNKKPTGLLINYLTYKDMQGFVEQSITLINDEILLYLCDIMEQRIKANASMRSCNPFFIEESESE